jgi:hypothetical protein
MPQVVKDWGERKKATLANISHYEKKISKNISLDQKFDTKTFFCTYRKKYHYNL